MVATFRVFVLAAAAVVEAAAAGLAPMQARSLHAVRARAAPRLDAALESTLGKAKSEAIEAYSELLYRLALDGSPAIFPACERMFHDGVRVRNLPFHVRQALEGKLPPEIDGLPADESFISNDKDAADAADASAGPASVPMRSYAPPGTWVKPAGAVPEVGPSEVERGWELAETTRGPVVFRGVGAAWPAVNEWRSMRTLAEQLPFVMVRVAPGPAVAFCRESHPDVRAGVVEPPSRVVAMSFGQFCRRLREGRGGLERLLSASAAAGSEAVEADEVVYMQALAPDGLLWDAFVEQLLEPRRLRMGAKRSDPMGRLWVCAPGVWSPCHYDACDSLLWQATGTKRMTLWPPRMTPALDPYPVGHALERRLRLSLVGEPPADEQLAAQVDASALFVELQPGDAVFFPAGWSHHTEAVRDPRGGDADGVWTDGLSISLGLRI